MPFEEGPDFGLFYTRTEFDDVIQRHRDTKDGYDDNAADYIYRLSCGHPGLVFSLLEFFKSYLSRVTPVVYFGLYPHCTKLYRGRS
ncbi:hypothetical protein V8E54_011491, partial [Elaphomyces granulatus]